VAVSDVTFGVEPGVTALLGPNGAGKSTTLEMLTGLLAPSTGTIRILGRPARGDVSLYQEIGLVPEQEAIYPFLTGFEFVRLNAVLQKLPDPDAAAAYALDLVELRGDADRRYAAAQGHASAHAARSSTTPDPPDGRAAQRHRPGQRAHLIELIRRWGRSHRASPRTSCRSSATPIASWSSRAAGGGRRLPRHPATRSANTHVRCVALRDARRWPPCSSGNRSPLPYVHNNADCRQHRHRQRCARLLSLRAGCEREQIRLFEAPRLDDRRQRLRLRGRGKGVLDCRPAGSQIGPLPITQLTCAPSRGQGGASGQLFAPSGALALIFMLDSRTTRRQFLVDI
jgi:energy-coupling factor transporter ATP-binding protein EcfA2